MRIGATIVLGLALTWGGVASAAVSVPPAARDVEAQARDRERDRAAALEDADAARGEIAGLNAQLAEFDRAQQAGEHTVSGKRLRLAALNAQEAELAGRLGAERAELARLLAVLEILRRDPPPALFVDPHDVKDAVRAAILIRAITPELAARAEALKAQAEALRESRRQAALASEDLFTAESDVAQRRAEIEALITKKTALEEQAEAEAKQADVDIAALNARARALSHLASGVALQAPTGGPAPPDPEHSGLFGRAKAFVQPVDGAPTVRFGATETGGSRAQGCTWLAAPRSAVAAPADGVVDYVGALKGWGVVVILRLGGDYDLVLAGLETADVRQGQGVKAGQVVGRMAEAGQPTDLYFEIRKNGVPVDPAAWLKSPQRASP